MKVIQIGDQIPDFTLPDKMFGMPTNSFGLLQGRVTYVADKSGKVIYIFNSQVKATMHVDEALRILNEMK